MGPPSQSSWAYSETAGAYYWKLRFGPGFDYDLPTNTAEVERIEKFWLDTGIDGFMGDVGTTDSRWKNVAAVLPKSYTNDKWLTFERNDPSKAADYAKFGINSWFNYKDDDTTNDYTRIVNGSIDADGLEAALHNTDVARQLAATTYAWSIWGDDAAENLDPHTYPTYPQDDVMRVQEAAHSPDPECSTARACTTSTSGGRPS
ncbi:alpha-amylase family glycosyl hydrolase [Streptomyces sp. 900105755]